jgi:hypothetical protein
MVFTFVWCATCASSRHRISTCPYMYDCMLVLRKNVALDNYGLAMFNINATSCIRAVALFACYTKLRIGCFRLRLQPLISIQRTYAVCLEQSSHSAQSHEQNKWNLHTSLAMKCTHKVHGKVKYLFSMGI